MTSMEAHRLRVVDAPRHSHIAGCRFGRFNSAAWTPGGYADFDFFHLGDRMLAQTDTD